MGYKLLMHVPWPVDGIEENSLEVANPRNKMRCARDSATVTTRMYVDLKGGLSGSWKRSERETSTFQRTKATNRDGRALSATLRGESRSGETEKRVADMVIQRVIRKSLCAAASRIDTKSHNDVTVAAEI